MAKVEYRTPIKSLLAQREKLNTEFVGVSDKFNNVAEQLAKLRNEETSYRMSLEALPKTAQHKPARDVFDKSLGDVRYRIQEISKELESITDQKTRLQSQMNSLSASIRELEAGQ